MNMNNLIELRKHLGLTQEQMSKIIGVKRNTYSSYETCNIIIPMKRLNIISNKYSKSLDFLLGQTSKNNEEFNKIDLNNKNIGKRLREVRLNLGMSTREIAKILNINYSTINRYETGKITITAPVIILYAELCHKSIDWLCCKK